MSSIVDSTNRGKQFFWITLGVLVLNVGMYYFLLPDNIVGGGSAGIAMVITNFIPIPYSIVNLAVNAFLLILGFIFIDKSFGGWTLYATLLGTGLMALFDIVYPIKEPITDNMLLNMIVGNAISACGVGWVFNASASTGGVDIIANILKKYTNNKLTFSQATVVADTVILAGTFTTFGIERGLIATIGMFFHAFLLNRIIFGGEGRFSITIMSSKVEEINEYIINTLDRSTTLYHAEGGYQRQSRLVINSIVDGRQLIKLKRFVQDVDPYAFFYMSTIHDIAGLGFTWNPSIPSAMNNQDSDTRKKHRNRALRLERNEHKEKNKTSKDQLKPREKQRHQVRRQSDNALNNHSSRRP
ncbi:MAG: YitT family protein [Aerococcus sp.]|nr:YitT family protein [Aerococcus sp.]